jgi:ubiquinone biosynthesis protein
MHAERGGHTCENAAVLRWPGNFVHYLFLVLVVLTCALVYGVVRAAIAIAVWGPRRQRAVARLRGVMLRRGMSTAGATFIKLGQVMSTRPDLFSPEVIDELRKLQDRLPPFSYRTVARTVEQELGRPIAAVFAEFDRQPVAAASVAQVHRARLTDGREVAVKVLRPGVRRQVERDQTILIGLARVIALVLGWRRSDPVGHTRHFVEAIHDQTDLSLEAQNYARFRQNFAGQPVVAFPEVFPELCTSRVLVMEFVRGTKIDALPPSVDAASRKRLAATLRTAMFHMCFEHGFVHADLHPGNMVVRDDGQLVLFDVGLAKLLHEDVLIQFIDMSKCIAMGTPDDLVGHLKRFHTYMADVDWVALRVDVEAFATKFRGQDNARLEYGELFGQMFAVGRKHHVRPVTDMMLVFVALITVQGIGKMLEPDHDVFASVAQFLIPVLMKRNETVPETREAKLAAGSGR